MGPGRRAEHSALRFGAASRPDREHEDSRPVTSATAATTSWGTWHSTEPTGRTAGARQAGVDSGWALPVRDLHPGCYAPRQRTAGAASRRRGAPVPACHSRAAVNTRMSDWRRPAGGETSSPAPNFPERHPSATPSNGCARRPGRPATRRSHPLNPSAGEPAAAAPRPAPTSRRLASLPAGWAGGAGGTGTGV